VKNTDIISVWNKISGPLASISTISGVGHVSTSNNAEKNWPNIQYFLMGFGSIPGMGDVFETIMNVKAKVAGDLAAPHAGRDANFILQVLTRPRSSGWIKLKGRDPWLKPIIQPNYLRESEDVIAMVEGFE